MYQQHWRFPSHHGLGTGGLSDLGTIGMGIWSIGYLVASGAGSFEGLVASPPWIWKDLHHVLLDLMDGYEAQGSLSEDQLSYDSNGEMMKARQKQYQTFFNLPNIISLRGCTDLLVMILDPWYSWYILGYVYRTNSIWCEMRFDWPPGLLGWRLSSLRACPMPSRSPCLSPLMLHVHVVRIDKALAQGFLSRYGVALHPLAS